MPGKRKKTEFGMALLAGLMILASISLLALVATASMATQYAMAGNFTDQQLADQSAREALFQGQQFLLGLDPSSRSADCLEDCFEAPLSGIIHAAMDLPDFPEFEPTLWWEAWGLDARTDPLTGATVNHPWNSTPEPPRYLLEELFFDSNPELQAGEEAPAVEGVAYYRILGRGTGRGPAAATVEEIILARPWPTPAEGDGDLSAADFCAAFSQWYPCGPMVGRQRR